MTARLSRSTLALAVVLPLLLAACSASASGPGAASPSSTAPEVSASAGPERVVQVFLPPDASGSEVPVIVLVPGGGWTSADPSGMVPLAEALGQSGSAVVTTTYRTESDGASFPVPLEDVVCAIAEATQRVSDSGVTPGAVVVVGHSAGAQLAALAALDGEQYHEGCASPAAPVDGFVGLAGPYDIFAFADVATGLFDSTPTEDPDTWHAANPMEQVGSRTDLPVLLLHGTIDDNVPPTSSKDFEAALDAAGHPVTLDLLPGVDHFQVYGADVAAGPIDDFVRSLG